MDFKAISLYFNALEIDKIAEKAAKMTANTTARQYFP